MHWRKINNIIEEAMARGEFDNLPGAGRPIDLDDYFRTPEHLRMGYKMLKENGFRPPEVELAGEAAQLRSAADRARTDAERDALHRRALEKETQLAIMKERELRARRSR